jgi:hypothetical protein
MRSRWTLILVIIASGLALASERGTIKVTVTYAKDNSPLGKASVVLFRSSPKASAADETKIQVGRDGTFSLELEPAFYDVLVFKPGFSPTCMKVEIRAGKKTVINPKLKFSELESGN